MMNRDVQQPFNQGEFQATFRIRYIIISRSSNIVTVERAHLPSSFQIHVQQTE